MPFFSLPREVRDSVYHYYVFEPDGYHFDYESGKLRASGYRPIHLALTYTCKTVAAEMHHLALGSNVINFSTVSSESERMKAGRFHLFFQELYEYKSQALRFLSAPEFQHYMTHDFCAKVELRYPQFRALLQLVPHAGDELEGLWWHPLAKPDSLSCSWGEPDSTFRGFQHYLIELLLSTDYFKALADYYDRLSRGAKMDLVRLAQNNYLLQPHMANHGLTYLKPPHPWCEMASFLRSDLLKFSPEPWSIPSESELAQMDTLFSPCRSNFWKRVKWRFSAAAAAIHFFKSVSQSTCLKIRKVVLHEDRRSVACPESHVLGLIPLCSQNPKLHIERRVNVWRNIIISNTAELGKGNANSLEGLSSCNDNDLLDGFDSWTGIGFSKACNRWIIEASALSANSMPVNSFSLILDGDPAPDQCPQLFEVMKFDAAWQAARTQWYAEKSLSSGLVDSRAISPYISELFPQALSDVIEDRSFTRCNFPTGEMYDPKPVLKRNYHLVSRDPERPGSKWMSAYARLQSQKARNIQISPPLPRLSDLALEDVIPEQEHDAA